ncbi:hypothetical protein [Metallibacterium scheffleri]
MSWAERLAELRAGKGPSGELTKLPKPHFVSFGSEQDGRFYPESAPKAPDPAAVIPAPDPEVVGAAVPPQHSQASTPPGRVLHLPANIAEQRQSLAEAMRAQGYDARLLERVTDADIDGCQWLSPEGFKRYAEILAARFGASGARP